MDKNIKRLIYLILFSGMFNNNVFGQNKELILQKNFLKYDLGYYPNFVAEEENKFVVYNVQETGIINSIEKYFLKVYDKTNFELIEEKEFIIDKKQKDNKFELNSIEYLNNKAVMFYNKINKIENSLELYAQEENSTPILLNSISANSRAGIFKNMGSLNVIFNNLNSEFLVFANNPLEDKKDNISLKLTIFGKDLMKKWERNVELPVKDKFYFIQGIIFDNEGNIFIHGFKVITKTIIDKNGNEKEKADNKSFEELELCIFKINTKNDFIDQVDLVIPENKIQDYKIQVSNNNIYIAGFYNDKILFPLDIIFYKGLFYFNLDKNSLKKERVLIKDFEEDFIKGVNKNLPFKLFDSKNSLTVFNRNKLLKEFNYNNLILKDDGSVCLVLENYYYIVTKSQSKHSSSGIGYSTTYTTTNTNYKYYYNDILVFNINPNAELSWVSTIPKRQAADSPVSNYASYSIKSKGNNLYFVFNDHKSSIKRLEKNKKVNTVNYYSKSAPTIVSLDQNGLSSRQVLYNIKQENLILKPKIVNHYYNSNSDLMFVFGYKNAFFDLAKEYKFGYIKL